MHSRPAGHIGDYESGFVLVGVVMFVLALTILGLSLFALSSYEGQFVDRSASSSQALDAAMSGIEHAKFVLARTQRLENVGAILYPSGVVYASARRTDQADPDSSGPLPPPDVAIAIRVLANVGGERRMVETRVLPQKPPHLFKRLMSISDSLCTRIDASILGFAPACGNYAFNGEIWEGGMAGLAWRTCAGAGSDSSLWKSSVYVPEPDVQSFFTQHLNDPMTQGWELGSGNPKNMQISLTGQTGPPTVSYIKTTNSDSRGQCSLFIPKHNSTSPGTLTINVSGWVVWMLPDGIHCDRSVTVQGSGIPDHDCLVIVAGKSTDPDNPSPPPLINYGYLGITFSAAIGSQDVPIILVTDGWLFDEHWFLSDINPDVDNNTVSVSYLSVFAHGASYWGPKIGTMNLNHAPNDLHDAPGGLIDQLCDQGALPNAPSGGITFKPIAGTWRELNPDNPPAN